MHSTLICQTCGATNEPARTHCFSCGTFLASKEEKSDMQDGSTHDAGHIWLTSQPQEYFLPGGLPIQQDPVWPSKPPARKSRRKLLALIGTGAISVGLVCGGSLWAVSSAVNYLVNRPPDNIFTCIKHNGPVYSIAWSPRDISAHIASASADTTVRFVDMHYDPDVYDLYPPAPYIYQGHTDSVNSVAWSPDGTGFASASRNGIVRITKIIYGHSTIHTYSNATVTDGNDVLTYTGHKGPVHAVVWSLKGTHLASASADTTVQVWDAIDGKTILTYRGHGREVTSLAWSPDNTHLASASTDGIVQVWNAVDGKTILTYQGHGREVTSLAWSPDGGTRLASASIYGTVHVWNVSDGRRILTYSGHKGPVRAVAWSPSGTYLASGSADTTVQIWDVTNGKLAYTYREHTAGVNTVAWSTGFSISGPEIDGATIASGSDDTTVRVWDVIGVNVA